ncbi:MAG TPA: DUF2232 domain-containing protein [Longimicrobiaceae bacterium]|nr:DUF2232 domain-containing protein [Longimicrobiaceae bacterium]
MNDAAGGGGARNPRWGVVAVLAASLLLGLAPLLFLALAVLGLLLPPRRPLVALASAAVVALFAVPAASSLPALVVFGWTAALTVLFALLSLRFPAWSFTARGLAAAGGALAGFGAVLAASGRWAGLERAVGEQVGAFATGWRDRFVAGVTDPEAAEQLAAAVARAAEWQLRVFPATVALYSLAVLALAWWVFLRLGGRERWGDPVPLRSFRFNDHLVWAAIAGAMLLLLPLGPVPARIGANLLLFMGGLYALRGFAILTFMVRGGLPALLLTGGAVVMALLNPLVLAVPMLLGIGDTWLDVRRRAALASRT